MMNGHSYHKFLDSGSLLHKNRFLDSHDPDSGSIHFSPPMKNKPTETSDRKKKDIVKKNFTNGDNKAKRNDRLMNNTEKKPFERKNGKDNVKNGEKKENKERSFNGNRDDSKNKKHEGGNGKKFEKKVDGNDKKRKREFDGEKKKPSKDFKGKKNGGKSASKGKISDAKKEKLNAAKQLKQKKMELDAAKLEKSKKIKELWNQVSLWSSCSYHYCYYYLYMTCSWLFTKYIYHINRSEKRNLNQLKEIKWLQNCLRC